MEIQIVDDEGAPKAWGYPPLRPTSRAGALYGVVAPIASVLRTIGEWNSLEIRCDGDRVRVSLNGAAVVDADMSKHEDLTRRPRSGFIGLANSHGHAKGTAFRNIRIREL